MATIHILYTLIEQSLKLFALLYYVVNCSCKPLTSIVTVIMLSTMGEFV